MQITISPAAALASEGDDTVTVSGDTITHNGTAFDLSSIPDGGSAEAEGDHPFAGVIERIGGVLHVPLRVQYDRKTAEPHQPRDPAHWVVTVTDGPLPDKVIRKGETA